MHSSSIPPCCVCVRRLCLSSVWSLLSIAEALKILQSVRKGRMPPVFQARHAISMQALRKVSLYSSSVARSSEPVFVSLTHAQTRRQTRTLKNRMNRRTRAHTHTHTHIYEMPVQERLPSTRPSLESVAGIMPLTCTLAVLQMEVPCSGSCLSTPAMG